MSLDNFEKIKKVKEEFFKAYTIEWTDLKMIYDIPGFPDGPFEYTRVPSPFSKIEEIKNFEDTRILINFTDCINQDGSYTGESNECRDFPPVVLEYREFCFEIYDSLLEEIWRKYLQADKKIPILQNQIETLKHNLIAKNELDIIRSEIGTIELWASENGFYEDLLKYLSSNSSTPDDEDHQFQEYFYKEDCTYFKINDKEINVRTARVRDFIKYIYYKHNNNKDFNMGAFIRDFQSKYKHSSKPKHLKDYFHVGTEHRGCYKLIQKTLFIQVQQGIYRLNPKRTLIE